MVFCNGLEREDSEVSEASDVSLEDYNCSNFFYGIWNRFTSACSDLYNSFFQEDDMLEYDVEEELEKGEEEVSRKRDIRSYNGYGTVRVNLREILGLPRDDNYSAEERLRAMDHAAEQESFVQRKLKQNDLIKQSAKNECERVISQTNQQLFGNSDSFRLRIPSHGQGPSR